MGNFEGENVGHFKDSAIVVCSSEVAFKLISESETGASKDGGKNHH